MSLKSKNPGKVTDAQTQKIKKYVWPAAYFHNSTPPTAPSLSVLVITAAGGLALKEFGTRIPIWDVISPKILTII